MEGTMNDQFTEQLSAYLDQELSDRDRAAVAAHLEQCEGCRRALAELRTITSWAPTYQGLPTSRDLWPAIESQLPRPDLAKRATSREWHARRVSIRVPVLLAAAVLLMLLSAGVMWLARSGKPEIAARSLAHQSKGWNPQLASFTEQQYDTAVAQLEQILAANDSVLDPATLKVIRESLSKIDQAILDARQAIARDSNNSYLNASIALNQRRKLDILRTAAQAVSAKS
jgi:hypothetical protein